MSKWKNEHSQRETSRANHRGLDPSGGAGIVADIKTIAAFGCFPSAALTSITFQNTHWRAFGAEHQTAETLRAQVAPIVSDGSGSRKDRDAADCRDSSRSCSTL